MIILRKNLDPPKIGLIKKKRNTVPSLRLTGIKNDSRHSVGGLVQHQLLRTLLVLRNFGEKNLFHKRYLGKMHVCT